MNPEFPIQPVAPNQTGPEEQNADPIKQRPDAILVVIVLGVVLFFAILAIILVQLTKNPEPEKGLDASTTTSNQTDLEKALAASRRDTQRREDMGRFMSQLTQYSANNRGNLPRDNRWAEDFVKPYLRYSSNDFDDPLTGPYTVDFKGAITGTITAPTNYGVIQIYKPATCNDSGTPIATEGTRRIAAYIKLETNGYYCINN